MNLKRTKTSKIPYEKSKNKTPSVFAKVLENSQKSVNLLNDIINNNNDQVKNFELIKNCLDNNHQDLNFLNDSSQKDLSSINENINNNFKNDSKFSNEIAQKDNENDIKNLHLNLIKKLSSKNLAKDKIEYSKKFRFSIVNGNYNQKNKRKSGFTMFNYKNFKSKLSMNQIGEEQEISLKINEKNRVRKFFSFLKKNNRNDKGNSRKDSILNNKRVNYISIEELYIEYPKLKKVLYKLKIIYFLCCLFILFSFIFGCVDNEMYNIKSWKFLEKKYYLTNYNKTKIFNETIIIDIQNRKISKGENKIRILNGICSFLACILLIIKFKFKQNQIKKNKKDIMNERIKNDKRLNTKSLFDLIIKRDKKRYLFLKLLITIIFYPPSINNIILRKLNFGKKIIVYAYSLNSIFVLINIPKLINIILYILEFSRYNSIISKKYCQNKIKINSEFRIKSIFQKYPLITCFIISTVLIIIITILKRFFDAFSYTIKYENEDIYSPYPLNEIYFALSVQSHHWFGDYKSITLISKIILYIGSTFGMIILSVWSFYFNLYILELNSEEKKAYMKLLKLHNYENTEYKATNLIKEFLNLRRLYINFNYFMDNGIIENYIKMFLKEKFIVIIKFRLELKYFRNEGKISRNYSLPLYDLLNSLEKKMGENIDNYNNQIDKLFEINNTLINFKNNNKIIIEAIIEIRKQNGVYEYLKQYYNEYYSQFITLIKPKLLEKAKRQLFFKQKKSMDYRTPFILKRNLSIKDSKLNNDNSENYNNFFSRYLKRKICSSTIKKLDT